MADVVFQDGVPRMPAHELGHMIRNRPLCYCQLPDHDELPAIYGHGHHCQPLERPALNEFIYNILSEAVSWIDQGLTLRWDRLFTKRSKPALAKVEVYNRQITRFYLNSVPHTADQNVVMPRYHDPKWGIDGKGESWFARRSVHANQSEDGSFTWSELENLNRRNHSKNEEAYSPDVVDAYPVLNWNNELKMRGLAKFSDIEMEIVEMCHKMPLRFLDKRVFPVLVISASTGRHESIVVQIPVAITGVARAFYSTGRNRLEGDSRRKRKPVVIGSYVSIERTRMLPNFDIEWIMATASDAGGNLPMWAQGVGVSSRIADDVGLFTKYASDHRSA